MSFNSGKLHGFLAAATIAILAEQGCMTLPDSCATINAVKTSTRESFQTFFITALCGIMTGYALRDREK